MRSSAIFCVLAVVLLAGCGPGGQRRVHLRLQGSMAGSTTLTTNSPVVQESLRILDGVVASQGFTLSPESADQGNSGCLRLYLLRLPPTTDQGRAYTPPPVPIRVWLTPTGIEAWFGWYGFLANQPEAKRAFVAVRYAFTKKFGGKNVKSHKFGKPNEPAAGDVGLRLSVSLAELPGAP